jgi:hypothetical protein
MTEKDIPIGTELDRLSAKIHKLSMKMIDSNNEYYGLVYPELLEMSIRLGDLSNNIFECIEELVEEGEWNGK